MARALPRIHDVVLHGRKPESTLPAGGRCKADRDMPEDQRQAETKAAYDLWLEARNARLDTDNARRLR